MKDTQLNSKQDDFINERPEVYTWKCKECGQKMTSLNRIQLAQWKAAHNFKHRGKK